MVQRKSSTKDNNINHLGRRDSDNMSGSQKTTGGGTTSDSDNKGNNSNLISPARKVQTMPSHAALSNSFRSQHARSPLTQKLSSSSQIRENSNSNNENNNNQFVTQTTKAIPTLATQIVNL